MGHKTDLPLLQHVKSLGSAVSVVAVLQSVQGRPGGRSAPSLTGPMLSVDELEEGYQRSRRCPMHFQNGVLSGHYGDAFETARKTQMAVSHLPVPDALCPQYLN